MTALAAFPGTDRMRWNGAALAAVAVHGAAVLLVVGLTRVAQAPVPEPVMVIELPPPGAGEGKAVEASPTPLSQPVTEAEPIPVRTPMPSVRIDVPQARVVPPDAVSVAPRTMDPVQRTAPAQTPSPSTAAPATTAATSATQPRAAAAPAGGDSIGNDPQAKKRQADWYAQIAAHLQRKKEYPREAKAAGQQGIVTVRFTVDRSGGVSDSSIKRSSGHDLLDRATLALMGRVAPLPPMPRSMTQDRVTISLPIEYTLTRK